MTDAEEEDPLPEESRSIEFSTLTDYFRRKAKREINETDQNRKDSMDKFRGLLLKENEKKFMNVSDELLLKCLRTKKFNVEQSLTVLKKYISYRYRYPELFDDTRPDYLSVLRNENFLNYLPYRARDGSVIWISKLGSWNPETVPFEGMLKFGYLCLDKVSESEVTQICGIHVIIDCKGLALQHILHITPSKIKCFVSGLQDCYPLRHKAFHIVNQPTIFSLLFTIAQPLLKKKLKDRIYLHGNDMSSLHQYLSPDILPEEYGGHMGPFRNDKFYSELFHNEPSEHADLI